MKRTVKVIFASTILLILGLSSCTDQDPTPAPADPRQAFIGVWSVTESELRLTYEVDIQLDPKSQNGGVYIYNFANAGSGSNPAYAFVSGNTISLEVNQIIGDGWIINGSGILSGTRINFHNISAVFTKL